MTALGTCQALALLGAASSLASCVPAGLTAPPDAPVAVGAIHVEGGRPAPGVAFRLLTERAAWDEDALASGIIQVWLRTASEASPGVRLATLPGTQRSLTLVNLRRDRHYAVLLRGWLDVVTAEGPASAQISVDADSIATFDTLPTGTRYPSVRSVAFQLQLADQTFAGQGRAAASIVGGTIVDTPQAERLAP